MSLRLLRHLWPRKRTKNFGEFKIVKPGIVTAQRTVPNHITKPDYYQTGEPGISPSFPEIKNEQQILGMRDSCKLAANILKIVEKEIKIGQTSDEIDLLVHNLIIENSAYPSPLNYKKFPKSICTSVNNVACHGIPDDRALENGDIINVDITVYYKGYHGDCSKTFLIGNVDNEGRKLVETTKICLEESIKICAPGVEFAAIGGFIEKRAKELGYTVVPAFVGHGIGSYFHGPPDIYHIRNNYPGVMEVGMCFTIEPCISQGGEQMEILEDGWTAISVDGARAAQFEHTILITRSGAEILTEPD